MLWVLVFVGIAVLGLIGLVGYVIWLWHKILDLLGEVEMVGRRAEEILDLLDDLAPLTAGSTGARPEAAAEAGERVPSGQVDLEFEPDTRGFGPGHALHRH